MTKKKQQHEREPTLGAFLRQAREEAGLSKLQLEAMSGVGRMTISRLETDWYQEPSPDDLVRLARALELNATNLFLLAGVPMPDQAASLDIMLRKSYGVSDEEIPALKQEIEELIARHHGTNKPKTTQGEGQI